ncbi:hypothetical protein DFP73DRAFT_488306 [Morchella snyderi]|nr:hypothetical protein DFP73DRAFT_488306 [Morchella snyderi]
MIVQVSKAIFLGRTPSKADWELARISTPYFGELTDTILRFKDSGSSVWDKETLEAAVTIADTARRAGENKESRTILENVLPIIEEIRGNEDPLTLDATNALSVVFINMKKWKEAERHLRTLVKIQEKQSFDITGCSYVTQLSNWARALVQLNRNDDARYALDIIAELGKHVEDPIEILTHKVKLAETQRFCGDLNKAEGLLLRVLEDSRILLGENHFRTMRILELLCYVYSDQKNWAQAELNSAKLVKLSQQALGPSQPDTVRRIKFHEKIRRRWGKQRE